MKSQAAVRLKPVLCQHYCTLPVFLQMGQHLYLDILSLMRLLSSTRHTHTCHIHINDLVSVYINALLINTPVLICFDYKISEKRIYLNQFLMNSKSPFMISKCTITLD
jgi:hypothetical protein